MTYEKLPDERSKYLTTLRQESYIKINPTYRPMVAPLLFAEERKADEKKTDKIKNQISNGKWKTGNGKWKILEFLNFHFPFFIVHMRLDLFLKTSRLILRRSLAQKFCDANLVKINEQTAKSSKEIKSGDEIEIKRGNRLLKVRVAEIPDKKQVSESGCGQIFMKFCRKKFCEE